MTKKRLLIIGPSLRRRTDQELLPALERFDGLFFKVARKYLSKFDVDVIVMKNDLTLIEGAAPLAYSPPQEGKWYVQDLSEEFISESEKKNEVFLDKKLRNGKYSEIFIAMGKKYAKALPDISKYNIKVTFPATGGLGAKARALKEWLI